MRLKAAMLVLCMLLRARREGSLSPSQCSDRFYHQLMVTIVRGTKQFGPEKALRADDYIGHVLVFTLPSLKASVR